jgi:hypothetical protein
MEHRRHGIEPTPEIRSSIRENSKEVGRLVINIVSKPLDYARRSLEELSTAMGMENQSNNNDK